MEATLIDYTGSGAADPAAYAAALLIFAKRTRLEMTPAGFADCLAMPDAEKFSELQAIANTIPASWEFIDYTWLIRGVTRGFTHQFVRGRHASYAQQSMRVVDVGDFGYGVGPSIAEDEGLSMVYGAAMGEIGGHYRWLLSHGAAIEDARGILPTNILTNILVKMNLRTFVETTRKRRSSRVQIEYRDVLAAMGAEVLRVHPWAGLFLMRDADLAAGELDNAIRDLPIAAERKTTLIKLLDQVRQK